MKKRWLERHDAYLYAHQQSVILMDLLISRQIEPNYFLRKTGLFYDDVCRGNRTLSAEQFAQLCDNASQPPLANELAFVFGQRMLPGYFGHVSSCLQNATSVRQALDVMVEFAALLFPLLTPTLRESPSHVYLDFHKPFGPIAPSLLLSSEQNRAARFVKEMTVSAIISFSNWLANTHLPWSVKFDYPAPDHQAEYEVFIGSQRTFEQATLSMSIAKGHISAPCQMASQTIYQLSLEASRDTFINMGSPQSLLSVIEEMLYLQVKNLPSLEQLAKVLEMSPATLKRKLKHHHTHYQKLCDQVRKKVSMQLINEQGYDEGQVADYLNFYDVSNFRRSFKRWLAY